MTVGHSLPSDVILRRHFSSLLLLPPSDPAANASLPSLNFRATCHLITWLLT